MDLVLIEVYLVLIEVLSNIFFVVYSSHQRLEKEFNMVLDPTALVDEGLGILTRTKVQHTLLIHAYNGPEA